MYKPALANACTTWQTIVHVQGSWVSSVGKVLSGADLEPQAPAAGDADVRMLRAQALQRRHNLARARVGLHRNTDKSIIASARGRWACAILLTKTHGAG